MGFLIDIYKVVFKVIQGQILDRAERNDLKSRFLLYVYSPFLLSSYLEGKRKGERNNQT